MKLILNLFKRPNENVSVLRMLDMNQQQIIKNCQMYETGFKKKQLCVMYRVAKNNGINKRKWSLGI